MTSMPIYQVDAFTDGPFSGNPAAVCPLESWPDDRLMQQIAAANNLSETAFFVESAADGADYDLRWFTPRTEVDLCGHATLASAFVVFEILGARTERVVFDTASGPLAVMRDGDRLVMDFPTLAVAPCDPPALLVQALGAAPVAVWRGGDYLALFEDVAAIAALTPDFTAMRGLDLFGVIATAPGRDCDFVSRFFAPAKGIDEDPVTGRAHCALTPFWAGRLGREQLSARQISTRGGALECTHAGDRVRLAGRARLYLEGTLRV